MTLYGAADGLILKATVASAVRSDTPLASSTRTMPALPAKRRGVPAERWLSDERQSSRPAYDQRQQLVMWSRLRSL